MRNVHHTQNEKQSFRKLLLDLNRFSEKLFTG